MVGGAAGDHHDPLHAGEQPLVEGARLVELHAVPAGGAVGDRLGDGVGLFVDLLEHERLEAALLGGVLVPVHGLGRALHDDAVGRHDGDAVGLQDDELAVFEVLHRAGLGEEGGYGGGDELLALAATDHERALAAGAHQRFGLVEAHRDEREVALQLGVGGAHGLGEVAGVVVGDQVGDHLGVGLGGEGAAFGAQALAQRHVVLDDPVDDHVDAVLGVEVGVGVLLAHAPVGGPAGVGDTCGGGAV